MDYSNFLIEQGYFFKIKIHIYAYFYTFLKITSLEFIALIIGVLKSADKQQA